MNCVFIIIILVLFFIFRKERFELDDTVRNISADRWADIIKSNRRYINQIDYYQPQSPLAPFAKQTGLDYKDAPQINLERAIAVSPITADDVNWEKLNEYEYSLIVGLLQGNYNRSKIKSINAG